MFSELQQVAYTDRAETVKIGLNPSESICVWPAVARPADATFPTFSRGSRQFPLTLPIRPFPPFSALSDRAATIFKTPIEDVRGQFGPKVGRGFRWNRTGFRGLPAQKVKIRDVNSFQFLTLFQLWCSLFDDPGSFEKDPLSHFQPLRRGTLGKQGPRTPLGGLKRSALPRIRRKIDLHLGHGGIWKSRMLWKCYVRCLGIWGGESKGRPLEEVQTCQLFRRTVLGSSRALYSKKRPSLC